MRQRLRHFLTVSPCHPLRDRFLPYAAVVPMFRMLVANNLSTVFFNTFLAPGYNNPTVTSENDTEAISIILFNRIVITGMLMSRPLSILDHIKKTVRWEHGLRDIIGTDRPLWNTKWGNYTGVIVELYDILTVIHGRDAMDERFGKPSEWNVNVIPTAVVIPAPSRVCVNSAYRHYVAQRRLGPNRPELRDLARHPYAPLSKMPLLDRLLLNNGNENLLGVKRLFEVGMGALIFGRIVEKKLTIYPSMLEQLRTGVTQLLEQRPHRRKLAKDCVMYLVDQSLKTKASMITLFSMALDMDPSQHLFEKVVKKARDTLCTQMVHAQTFPLLSKRFNTFIPDSDRLARRLDDSTQYLEFVREYLTVAFCTGKGSHGSHVQDTYNFGIHRTSRKPPTVLSPTGGVIQKLREKSLFALLTDASMEELSDDMREFLRVLNEIHSVRGSSTSSKRYDIWNLRTSLLWTRLRCDVISDFSLQVLFQRVNEKYGTDFVILPDSVSPKRKLEGVASSERPYKAARIEDPMELDTL